MLRAGEGVLGPKSQGGERKEVEMGERGNGRESMSTEGPLRRKEKVATAATGSSDKLLIPDNRSHQRDRSSLSTLTAEEAVANCKESFYSEEGRSCNIEQESTLTLRYCHQH